jgi:hypothetical protein
MSKVTLTNIRQLADYAHINQYMVISYNNENANQYFGNFNESTNLQNDDAIIQVLDVESVNVSQSEDGSITNFVMNSIAPIRMVGSYIEPLSEDSYGHTIAFNEITTDMRFDVITFDTATILVAYQRYVPKRSEDKDISNNNNNDDDNQII